jgi:hypothetical protein
MNYIDVIINYLTPKVGGPVYNTAVEKPGKLKPGHVAYRCAYQQIGASIDIE